MPNISLKFCDLLDFSKMCEREFNIPELSDRVLVFDVMQDDWESATVLGVLNNACSPRPNETVSSENLGLEKPKEPRSDELKEEFENKDQDKVKGDETEFGKNDGLQSENESEATLNLICKQESNVDGVNRPTTCDSIKHTAMKAESPGHNSENFNEPLRQHKIHVHSFWLSVQSPYFRSLFYSSGMKENYDKEVHVKVSESEENAHLIVLEAIYRDDVLNDKTVDELLIVLELACKYDLKFVFKKCKYILQENATTFEICKQIMHMIRVKHNMDDVDDLATTLQFVLAREFSPLDENWQSEKFTCLPEQSLKYLLSSNDLIVQSENTVFHTLMHWMEQNEIDPTSLKESNDLLSVVRFELVTIDYLYNVIKHHPIASKMPKFNELYLNGMTYHAIPEEQKTLLEQKPAVRKEPEGIIYQHALVFKEQDFQTALNAGTYESSDIFWACGYKFGVSLSHDSNYGYGTVFPLLCVRNLKKESLVHVNFAFTMTKRNVKWSEKQFRNNCPHEKFSYSIPKHETCTMHVAIIPL